PFSGKKQFDRNEQCGRLERFGTVEPVPVLSLDTVSRRDDRGGTGMTTSGGGPVERMLAGPPGGGSDTVVAESADAAGLRNAFLTHGVELYGYARRSLGDPAPAE